MEERPIMKLNLIEILERELILNSAYEESLINLIKPVYDLNKPELIQFYKQFRINHLSKEHKNRRTYNPINIENQVEHEFERIKRRVEIYQSH